jgi:hypothetical protein
MSTAELDSLRNYFADRLNETAERLERGQNETAERLERGQERINEHLRFTDASVAKQEIRIRVIEASCLGRHSTPPNPPPNPPSDAKPITVGDAKRYWGTVLVVAGAFWGVMKAAWWMIAVGLPMIIHSINTNGKT